MDSRVLADWLSSEAQVKARAVYPFFSSRHLNELDIAVSGDSRDVRSGLDTLRTLKRLGRAYGADVVPKLAIPFGDTRELEPTLPDLRDVPALEPYEPPSLYLFAPGFLQLLPDREEYRCAYPGAPWAEDVSVEYVCGRSLSDRVQGWEFVKTIWVSVID